MTVSVLICDELMSFAKKSHGLARPQKSASSTLPNKRSKPDTEIAAGIHARVGMNCCGFANQLCGK